MSQAAAASSRQSSSARSVERAGERALLPGRGVEEGGGEGAGLRTLVRTCQHNLRTHLDVSGKTMLSPSSPVVPVLAVSMLTLTISVSIYLYSVYICECH